MAISEKDAQGIAALIVLGLFIYGCHAITSAFSESDQEKQTRIESEANQLAEYEAQQKADDEKEAQKMGVSYSQYKAAEKLIPEVAVQCLKQLRKKAPWGANTEYGHDWFTDGKEIGFTSSAIVKNAFNAERRIIYACDYHIETGKTKLLPLAAAD